MILNLAVSDMFEDMCGYLMMKRDDRGSWRRLSYNTVVRRLPWPEGLMLMSMKGTSVPECAQKPFPVLGRWTNAKLFREFGKTIVPGFGKRFLHGCLYGCFPHRGQPMSIANVPA